MKKILIKENTDQFKEIAKDLKQFMPVLNELKASFEALEIGAFTNDDFKKIILLGTSTYVEVYTKSLNNQLDKQGITNTIIRQNAIKGHEKIIERFKKAVYDAKNFQPEIYTTNRPKLSLKFISFENYLFVISKEDKEMILETFCRIYLEDEESIKILELIKNLQKYFNEFLEIMENSGIKGFNKFLLLGNVFQINNQERAEINPVGLKYVTTYKKRSENFNSLGTR